MTPYILYNGEKVYVTIEGYNMTNTGLKVNVKAVDGFPFNGQRLESRGDYSGGSFPNCNSWTTYAYNVKFESNHAVDEAYAQEQELNKLTNPEPSESLHIFEAHNTMITKRIYKISPFVCAHQKESAERAGMRCRGCGRIRNAESDFETRLVQRYNPRGDGYVHYR